MGSDAPDLPVLDDPAVPADHVLGAGAADVLQAALAGAGATLERSRPGQTTYHPGRSLTVLHHAKVRWPDGRRTDEDLVLSAGKKPPEGALTVGDGTDEIVVWRVPHDPWLPGLAAALDPDAMATLLATLGMRSATPLRCRIRAYRPARRAVVEVTGSGVRAFLKVVRPHKAEALHRAHVDLAATTPVPQSLGWSPERGIVVLQALPGRTLREALLAGFGLPGPAALLAVLDALPPLPTDAEAPAPDWRAREFGALLSSIAPDLAERIDALAVGLDPFEAAMANEPVVPVHADYYEAQLLVDGGKVTGLLDVDTFRPGHRVDDLATMIGHLSVLAIGTPQRDRIEAYASRLLDGFDQTVDPALLRAAVAGVVLGLATGSFRVLEASWRHHTERRIALAEQWLASAQRVAASRSEPERTLTAAQSAPQTPTAH